MVTIRSWSQYFTSPDGLPYDVSAYDTQPRMGECEHTVPVRTYLGGEVCVQKNQNNLGIQVLNHFWTAGVNAMYMTSIFVGQPHVTRGVRSPRGKTAEKLLCLVFVVIGWYCMCAFKFSINSVSKAQTVLGSEIVTGVTMGTAFFWGGGSAPIRFPWVSSCLYQFWFSHTSDYYLFHILFDHEDGGITFPRNVSGADTLSSRCVVSSGLRRWDFAICTCIYF
jgi:hypothetical protein